MSGPNTTNRKPMASHIMLMSRVLWNERNARVLRKKSTPSYYILKLMQDEAKLLITAGAKHLDTLMA